MVASIREALIEAVAAEHGCPLPVAEAWVDQALDDVTSSRTPVPISSQAADLPEEPAAPAWQADVDAEPGQPPEPEPRHASAIGAATAFLSELLAGDPRPSAEVTELAAASGISARTLARARSRLGVVSAKQPDGRWALSLPAA